MMLYNMVFTTWYSCQAPFTALLSLYSPCTSSRTPHSQLHPWTQSTVVLVTSSHSQPQLTAVSSHRSCPFLQRTGHEKRSEDVSCSWSRSKTGDVWNGATKQRWVRRSTTKCSPRHRLQWASLLTGPRVTNVWSSSLSFKQEPTPIAASSTWRGERAVLVSFQSAGWERDNSPYPHPMLGCFVPVQAHVKQK